LSQIGRAEEAEKSLKEALELGRGLHHQVLIAQTLNLQGENAWYRGDISAARVLFDRAVKEASGTTDRRLQLLTKLNAARVALPGAVKGKELQTLVGTLRGLVQQADVLGLKYLSVESSIALGEALVKAGEPVPAQRELERAIAQSEKLGTRALLAKSHYLIGMALRQGGNESEATRHVTEARRLLDEIRKEAGTNDLLKRADLKPIVAESSAPANPARR
jgi:tetratricopeptide (TPR) repeat protein